MNGNMKFVYTITDVKGRSVWDKIGVAFVNSDGSLNVRLNALPIDGRCHIRDAPISRQHHDHDPSDEWDPADAWDSPYEG